MGLAVNKPNRATDAKIDGHVAQLSGAQIRMAQQAAHQLDGDVPNIIAAGAGVRDECRNLGQQPALLAADNRLRGCRGKADVQAELRFDPPRFRIKRQHQRGTLALAQIRMGQPGRNDDGLVICQLTDLVADGESPVIAGQLDEDMKLRMRVLANTVRDIKQGQTQRRFLKYPDQPRHGYVPCPIPQSVTGIGNG